MPSASALVLLGARYAALGLRAAPPRRAPDHRSRFTASQSVRSSMRGIGSPSAPDPEPGFAGWSDDLFVDHPPDPD